MTIFEVKSDEDDEFSDRLSHIVADSNAKLIVEADSCDRVLEECFAAE